MQAPPGVRGRLLDVRRPACSVQDGPGVPGEVQFVEQALWKALGICPGEVTAFTGGGGKSSTARRVARELLDLGRPAIFTTTTKIYPAPEMELVFLDREGTEAVSRALGSGRSVCVAAGMEAGSGRLLGISAEQVASLAELGAGAVLVEADGSARLPLKAPAAHEPVIPPQATLVVPVAGASALGRPLDHHTVHRPEETAHAAGVALGASITPEVMAAALLACTRGTPDGARVVPLLSQADLRADLASVARLLLGRSKVGRVVEAAPRTDQPVRALHREVVCVVLAGGASRRFGGSKLLHAWRGRTILEASLEAALRCGLGEVVVVTGAYGPELETLLRHHPVRLVPNPAWEEGMSTSLKAGLRSLESSPPSAVMIFLGDQPLLPAHVPAALANGFRATGAPIVAPAVQGQRRSPVLFDWGLLPELLELTGDEGGRQVVRRYAGQMEQIEYTDQAWFQDIDTRDDLLEAKRE